MSVKINISGTNISGNAKVLNGLNLQGKSNITDISMENSSISGNSQTLNEAKISGNASVHIENSQIKETARVLNNLDVEGQVNVELKDLSLGEGVKFMDGKKFTEKTSHQQKTDTKPATSVKKDGLLKKFLKLILKRENVEEPTDIVKPSQNSHKNFENKISMGGNLKNLDTSEALCAFKKATEELKKEQKSIDETISK